MWLMCPLSADWQATKYTIRCDICGLRTARVTTPGMAKTLWNNKLSRMEATDDRAGDA